MKKGPSFPPGLPLRDRLALTIREAALVLGVSERHVRSHLGDLPHLHLGGRVLVPVEGLREWVRRQAEAEEAGVTDVVDEILKEVGR